MKTKVVFLGGGSPFVPAMIKSLLERRSELDDVEIGLMDVDPSRLSTIEDFGRELSRRAGASFNFFRTTDPTRALADADFVFPTYRVGGLEHMKYDIEIPTRYGVSGDETTGPGGTFMAQMTIPVTLEYCRMIEDLCPDSWVISVINPANAVGDAVFRKSDVNYVPVCDCHAGLAMETIPKILDLEPKTRQFATSEDFKPRSIGVNHMTWLVELKLAGKDAYDRLKREYSDYGGEKPHDQEPTGFSQRLLDLYGYINTCPTHVKPYWAQQEFLEERREEIFEERVLGWSEKRWGFIENFLDGAPYEDHPDEYCFSPHHANQAIGLMMSILNDEGREWGGVNFINNGVIPNLPDGAVVEGPASVDSSGLHPINVGELPEQFVSVTRQIIHWQQLTVDAALAGDRDLLLRALLACPYLNDVDKAEALMHQLLRAHREYLPQYG